MLVRAIDIVPRTYKQVHYVANTSDLKTTTKKICGRKIPLHELVKHFIQKLDKAGLMAINHYNPAQMTNEQVQQRLKEIGSVSFGSPEEQAAHLHSLQTTLHIMNWGDHSAVSGHGYLVYTITPMFDAAVFAHPEKSVAEVQRLVEQPHPYIIAMSSDTCHDKLMYIPDRKADIKQLKVPIDITDNIKMSVNARLQR